MPRETNRDRNGEDNEPEQQGANGGRRDRRGEGRRGADRTGGARAAEGWISRIGRGLLGAGLGIALVLSIPGCHKSAQAAGSQSAVDQNAGDPADANMAQADAGQPAQALGESAQNQNQQQGEDYSQQPPAPIVRQSPDSGQQSYDNGAAENGAR